MGIWEGGGGSTEGGIDGKMVRAEVVGSGVVGELVGSGVVGELVGSEVRSKVAGETEGDAVGGEVVGDNVGKTVGSEVGRVGVDGGRTALPCTRQSEMSSRSTVLSLLSPGGGVDGAVLLKVRSIIVASATNSTLCGIKPSSLPRRSSTSSVAPTATVSNGVPKCGRLATKNESL